ncbi:uncharacterized protein LOC106074455 isoform X2 [Biomphalaria glabrata]|uniref:Uncharacterized protein LOC106074455 isoform X2 n=1 Tax=Biomphalaria glabrata TaxID=6526 RepID=A0A9W3B8I8_BIOGL|nr:uncharacterized protein LOC106074455 isoform X2 [Biomphalaria glabrata]
MLFTRRRSSCGWIACVTCLFSACLLLLINNFLGKRWMALVYFSEDQDRARLTYGHFTSCPDVLNRMVVGHWSNRNYTAQELEEVESGVLRLRQFHKIPDSLQRNDSRCGNIGLEGLFVFRALCNPKGPTPCCYNNVCANKTVQECQCPQCYDFRTKLHAELADWIPDDPTCKILKFQTKKEVCDVLHNTTLYFVGDSFIRQLYISVLGLFDKNDTYKVFAKHIKKDMLDKCDKYYRYISECRRYINTELMECNNSLIDPLLTEAKRNEWPKLVWFEPHAPGLMKTPHIPHQLAPYRIPFNAKVKELMEKHRIPNLRFYSLTEPVLSYDGAHYGKGVNDVKVQILLNFLLEQRTKLNSLEPV